MNKKGFTLVELLAVIVILGIIVTIVYPTVISTIHSSEKKAFDTQKKTIEKAMKMYYLDHSDELKDLNDYGTMDGCDSNDYVPAVDNVNTSDFITKLINQGYISDNETENNQLIDPCTDQPMDGTVIVNWICDKKQYEYKFDVENTCD